MFTTNKHTNTYRVFKECDVLVAGGGVAGISAALAAARNGAKVVLAEKQCMLGGLATLGLITIYLPLCDGCGNQIIYGIGEELLRLSIKHGYEDRYPKAWIEGGTREEKINKRFEVQYNPYIFAILAEQLLISEGVEIIYDTIVTGVEKNGDMIDTVIIVNKEGHLGIKAKTVVDATGDADICSYAGEQTATFTENRFAAWYYTYSKKGLILNTYATPLYSCLSEKDRIYDGLKTDDINAMIIKGHKDILDLILETRQKENDETIVPTSIPLVPEFRMTRRLVGLYELDEAEERKTFEDSIGMTGDWRMRGPIFDIPYRTLYGQKIKNLITAGRCISVTESMWDITRVIPTCAVTGEAAGTAAALAVRNANCGFGDLKVTDLQKVLVSNGININKRSFD